MIALMVTWAVPSSSSQRADCRDAFGQPLAIPVAGAPPRPPGGPSCLKSSSMVLTAPRRPNRPHGPLLPAQPESSPPRFVASVHRPIFLPSA